MTGISCSEDRGAAATRFKNKEAPGTKNALKGKKSQKLRSKLGQF
jgi:hypothetical protein